MKLGGGFEKFVSNFFIGALNLFALTLYYILALTLEREGNLLTTARDILSRIEPFGLLIGTVSPFLAVLLGYIIDAIGHLWVDRLPLRRIFSPPEQIAQQAARKDAIMTLVGRFTALQNTGNDSLITGIFYAHAQNTFSNFLMTNGTSMKYTAILE